MKKDTKFIELTCHDCVVRISPWDSTISVELISTSASHWHSLLGTRIRNAWRVLRGQYDWSGFDLLTKYEAQTFISALEQVSDDVWPVDEES